MIAKRVARRRDGKSSFGALVKYLEDDKGKAERVGDVTVTNCGSEDTQWAVLEIEATQDLNRRAKSDKTYHLVFSFREGEDISPEVLREIEAELCKGLGYEDHQRISVVHRDTDNLHVHVAINKIHPETHNLIEPYYDHKRLGELCARIEVQHGLERDNHAASKSAAESKADDLAAKTGMETLVSWLRENAVPGAAEASSWAALHEHFAQHGVDLRKQGAGLVFVGEGGVTVKASSVSRGLSIKALEGRLGEFAPREGGPIHAKKAFQSAPRKGANSEALFARYQAEQANNILSKRDAMKLLQGEKAAALAAVLRSGKTKRAATKMLKGMGAGAISRKVLYSQIAKSQKAAIAAVHEEFAERRKKLHEAKPKQAFRDWLSANATKGDKEALDYLRARGSRMKGNTVDGQGKRAEGQGPQFQVDSVTRTGAVTYRTPAGPIRDDGNRFQLGKEPSDQAIATALDMAMKRHGNNLTLTGDDSFKTKVARVAGELGLAVSFNDPATEKARKSAKDGAFRRKAAAEKYISERNEKRAMAFDIMKHRHFEPSDEGLLAFSGLRKVEGVSVALFKRGDEVLALPVSDGTASRLQRQKLGQQVQVSATGEIQVKGTTRSR